MRLNKEIVDRLMQEKGIDEEQLARLYKGSKGEYWVMCHFKCGFKRAYQLAEIFDCSVDDLVIYGDDHAPKQKKARKKYKNSKNSKNNKSNKKHKNTGGK